MIRKLRNLRSDERGAALIEMALATPIFCACLMGMVDLSRAYSERLQLEQATQRAIEKVMQTTGIKSVADTIIDEVADQADIPDDEKAEKITVTYSLECDDDDPLTSTDADTFDTYACAEGTVRESRYIEVEVNDVYEPMFPVHFSSYNADLGGYAITAKAGMRTK